MAKRTKQTNRTPRWSQAKLIDRAKAHGAKGAKVIDPKTVVTEQWVRWKCRYGCGGYGSSLVCPPRSPTPDETRRMLDGYKRGVLFEAAEWQGVKPLAVSLERELFLTGYYKAFGLGAGPCTLCKECAFDEGCRHPNDARPAMEACGIDVFATVRENGFVVNVVRKRTDPQHYFGLVLVD